MDEKARRELLKTSVSKNAKSSGSANSRSKSLWKLATVIPRLFVSKEAAARSRSEEKEAEKCRVDPSPDFSNQPAAELLIKSPKASKSAEAAQKIAADSRTEADQARACADSMRQSYQSCMSGMGSP